MEKSFLDDNNNVIKAKSMNLNSVIFNLNDTDHLIMKVISAITDKDYDIELGAVTIPKFSDGETSPHFNTSVRGKRVYLLISPNTAEKIMILNLAIDAAKRASAIEIIPILPYFPYSRQDKRDQYRGPIGAKVIAEMMQNRGATSIITFDLHADQIEGFFDIPVIHMKGKYVFFNYILSIGNSSTIFCSPDAGGVKRVTKFRDLILKKFPSVVVPYVTIDKTRTEANKVDDMVIIGNVSGKEVIIIDDLCDTGGTLVKAADTLLKAGALSVSALITHPVLSGKAYETIGNSNLKRFICSDSLELHDVPESLKEKLTVVSMGKTIGHAIISINNGISLNGAK